MRKQFAFLVNLSLLSAVLGQCTVEKAAKYFQRSVNEFGNELVTRISEETDSHFVTSTLSLWTLLAAISFGAADDTLDELETVLGLHPQPCFNRKFLEVVKGLNSVNDGVVFVRSTSVFGDYRMPFTDSFRRKLDATGVIKLEEINFDNADEVAVTINEYVKSATGGNIDEIVTPTDLYREHLVFIDALYFKGLWKYQFDPQGTIPSKFHDSRGEHIGNANFMHAIMQANTVDFTQIEAKVLELPYANNRFSMLIVLPNIGVSVSAVIDNLKNFSLRSIFVQFVQPEEVHVQIPRFQISSDHSNLKELLIDIGLKSMFESGVKFPELAEYALYVSNIIQKATIEVSEDGSEASVVSGATFMEVSANINMFVANRPFLYMIVDKQTEIALFTGAYSTPSLY